jgi:hypothetical protein
MEILINVIGYAGFIAIATYHKSTNEKFPDRWALESRAIAFSSEVGTGSRQENASNKNPEPGTTLVRFAQFTRSADEPVGFYQCMTAFGLRSQRKADDDEGKAKQQADQHDAPVGRFVRVVKRRDHGLFSWRHPYRNLEGAQRDLGFNLTE